MTAEDIARGRFLTSRHGADKCSCLRAYKKNPNTVKSSKNIKKSVMNITGIGLINLI